MIELKNVTKIYNSKKGTSTTALNNINLKIGNRGMLFIVGKSGSGKSTLLNLLGGLDNLTSGEILINGKNISNFNDSKYDSYRNTYIGFIFQEFNVLEQYNVYENINLALKLQNQNRSKIEIDNLLDNLGIKGLGNRKINELSGGQKQRVAIARALIKKPKIILADEPTGNLDSISSEQIFNILKEISKERLVIVVSHDIESAKKYADRIVQIHDGQIVADTSPLDNIENDTFNLEKSKLPFSYALKMSLTSFKSKPFKLVMTIILTAISLIFMGVTVNWTLFEHNRLIINTMKDNNDYIYNVKKSKYGPFGSISILSLEENEMQDIKKLTNSIINPIYSLYDNGHNLAFEFGDNNSNLDYYKSGISNSLQFIEINDSRILGKLIGREPKTSNEIVVHKYFADYIIKFGIMKPDNNLYFPKDYNEIVNSNQEIKLGENKVIITGIIDADDSLYQDLKNGGSFESDEFASYFRNNYSSKGSDIYVKGFTDNAILIKNKLTILNSIVIKDNYASLSTKIYNNINPLNENITIISKDGPKTINSLSKNEVVISLDALQKFSDKAWSNNEDFDFKFNEYLKNHSNMSYEDGLKEFISIYLQEKSDFKLQLLQLGINEIDAEVVGVSLDNNNYISYQYVEEYEPIMKNIKTVRIYDDDINNLKKSLKNLVFNDFFEGLGYEYGTYYNYTVDIDNQNDLASIMGIYKYLEIYILIISLIFMLFTLLLFLNFISVSILYCKKEIGILRALGATKNDIIKIFGYESIIIGLISWILSIIGWILVCNILNNSLFGNMYYTLNGIVMHPIIPIFMLVYILAISILITVSSIGRITKIKPIDAILNK